MRGWGLRAAEVWLSDTHLVVSGSNRSVRYHDKATVTSAMYMYYTMYVL